MKKEILYLCVTTMLFNIRTTFAQYVTPISVLEVPAAYVPVTIDGTDEGSEGYTGWQTTMICKEAGTGVMPHPGDSVDFNVRFKLTWDYTYLYLIADIVDDIENDYLIGKTTPRTWDNVEVFIDLDTNSLTPNYSTTSTTEMRFCRGLIDRKGNDSLVESNSRGAGGAVQSNGQNEAAMAQREQYRFYEDHQSSIDGKKGWHFEVAIPWSAATDSASVDIHGLTVPDGGTVVGFDLGAGDSDSDADNTGNGYVFVTGGSQAFWDFDNPEGTGNEDNAYRDRRLFGFIQLIGGFEGINYNRLDLNTKVFPNPAIDKVTFSGLTGYHTALITNLLGQTVRTIDITSDKATVDITDLPAGIYFFKPDNSENAVKFVKQ